jgi:SagB-type dehydrogenase family enzyme
LPTTLIDAPPGTLAVLESAVEALPDSFMAPPQTLKTLASWLYLSDGILSPPRAAREVRTCPGEDEIYPFEIYVAAFALQDIEPGLYHYDPYAFCLRKLREGPETLSQLKRGRPDLEFLKRAPGALLVASTYAKAAAAHGSRGYRTALVQCGEVVQNLVTAASGLGIQTITRLRMTDSSMRELVGVPDHTDDLAQEEAVQAMVVWADRTQREAILVHTPATAPREPIAPPTPAARPEPVGAAAVGGGINQGGVAVASLDFSDLALPSIGRSKMAAIRRTVPSITSPLAQAILTVHEDCVAPGMAVREVRPPLTELTPLPEHLQANHLGTVGELPQGEHLRSVLLRTPSVIEVFTHDAIPRNTLRVIHRLSFARGSYYPLFPDGLHVALVRPFWVVHHVAGMEEGIWYAKPDTKEWFLLRPGAERFETKYLAAEQDDFGDAAVVCMMVINLNALLLQGGPDTYRLAHLEAGTVAQRIALAAGGFGCKAKTTTIFYDEEVRRFLGLEGTGWEPLCIVGVGHTIAG